MGIFDLFKKSTRTSPAAANTQSLDEILPKVREGKAKAFNELPPQEETALIQWVQSIVDLYSIELQRVDRGVYKSRAVLPESYENIRFAMALRLLWINKHNMDKELLENTFTCYLLLKDYLDVPQEQLQDQALNQINDPSGMSDEEFMVMAARIASQGNPMQEYQSMADTNEKELKAYLQAFIDAAK